MSDTASTAAVRVALPKGGGGVAGFGETFSPELSKGTGAFMVPIALSKGRDGFGPSLQLEYSTGNGNGAFGLGWRLSLPEIAQQTRKGLPQYSSEDQFVLLGADDLVHDRDTPDQVRGSYRVARYRSRTEQAFARIELWQSLDDAALDGSHSQSFWRVTTRDNVTSIFGLTRAGTVAAPGNASRISRWQLELAFDGKGNFVRYHYKAEDQQNVPEMLRRENVGQSYLKRIRYGNLNPVHVDNVDMIHQKLLVIDTSDCLFEVVLDYGEHGETEGSVELVGRDISSELRPWDCRKDAFSSFAFGFDMRTYRLCRRILMLHHFPEEFGTDEPLLVRSVDFYYKVSTYNTVTTLSRVTKRGYQRASRSELKLSTEYHLPAPTGSTDGVGSYVYEIADLPPLDFTYSQFEPVDTSSVKENLHLFRGEGETYPRGLEDPDVTLVDLFGRGLPDILQMRPERYSYWRNEGNGRFSSRASLPLPQPKLALRQPEVGLADLSGDGYPDILELSAGHAGYYTGSPGEGWREFQQFPKEPPFQLQDPNVRLLDLTGDGRLDALRSDADGFVLFECEGADGFDEGRSLHRGGVGGPPRFSEPNVYIADMNGDGLDDIVRAENGVVEYWPNCGFGVFGASIRSEIPELLAVDQDRTFFVDIDGSGPADLLQVQADGSLRFWLNQFGNGWSEMYLIQGAPAAPVAGRVKVADLLGEGVMGVLWSSPEGIDRYRYLPLVKGLKPGLLVGSDNNMGRGMEFRYISSTALAQDVLPGALPSSLPFPVYLLARVDTLDHLTGSRLTTEFRYAHGRYDGEEREFVGFGRVDQWDSEYFGLERPDDSAGFIQSPVLTRNWYHPGTKIGTELGRPFVDEYYQDDPHQGGISDTEIEPGLSASENRDALRALRGRLLRQETFSPDGSAKAEVPYAVSEHGYKVRRVCPEDADPGRTRRLPGVFAVHEREVLKRTYDRVATRPNIKQKLVLEVDDFDNVLLSVDVAYGRLKEADSVDPQTRTWMSGTRRCYGRRTEDPLGYRHSVLVEEQILDITGVQSTLSTLLQLEEARALFEKAESIAFEAGPSHSEPQKRVVAWTRSIYWDDSAENVLPHGEVGLRALPHCAFQAALTEGLVKAVYGTRFEPETLSRDCGYVLLDGIWWRPSGEPNQGEKTFDADRFFLPIRATDPFGNVVRYEYDSYALAKTDEWDSVGNRLSAEYDYRALEPSLLIDANGNRTRVLFDALGMAVLTAFMGKEGEAVGDDLEGAEVNLSLATVQAFVNDPVQHAAKLLGRASSRVIYDLGRFQRAAQPPLAATLAREVHLRDPEGGSGVQISFAYSDGLGRTLQTKARAEPGIAPVRAQSGAQFGDRVPGDLVRDPEGRLTFHSTSERWVGSGRTTFNNKGKPVRQYEPFFSSTPLYEPESEMAETGVSSVLFYDPIGRVIAKIWPNQTYEKLVHGPWQREVHDANDTVAPRGAVTGDPRSDVDVAPFAAAYLHSQPGWTTWYAQRIGGEMGAVERDAAVKAARSSDTPAIVELDSLGREYRFISQNRNISDGDVVKYAIDHELDVSGQVLSIRDQKGRIISRSRYDMSGALIHETDMERGDRWFLVDVAGNSILKWDSRQHRTRTEYDGLRRPIRTFVSSTDTHSVSEVLIERIIYGEQCLEASAANLRGALFLHADQSGIRSQESLDFKGNVVRAERRLRSASGTGELVDWSAVDDLATTAATSGIDRYALEAVFKDVLEPQAFTVLTKYDALNRVSESTTPHSQDMPPSLIRRLYNAGSLLERLDVNHRGASDADGELVWTQFVQSTSYNARGQRQVVVYGNGVRTDLEYDRQTFQLASLTTRGSGRLLQSLEYTYDPVGNVTHVRDSSQQEKIFDNQLVDADCDYTYDALYRLVEATGRERLFHGSEQVPHSPDDASRIRYWHPNDGSRLGRYVEAYDYDEVGNIVEMRHRSSTSSPPSWTRQFSHTESSSIDPMVHSNRLSRVTTSHSPHAAEVYLYDAHGNLVRLPHLGSAQDGSNLEYDFYDRMVRADLGGGGVVSITYDARGIRARKAWEKSSALLEERLYFDGFELYRRSQGKKRLERELVQVVEGEWRIGTIETRTHDSAGEDLAPERLIRYELGNHLGSTSLEVDEHGRIISYEEYSPYGSTVYRSVRSELETPNRYRYTGKERDEETGLYYFGARYFAPWLGRWTGCDPLGFIDSTNLYTYAQCNPVTFADADGRAVVGALGPQKGARITDPSHHEGGGGGGGDFGPAPPPAGDGPDGTGAGNETGPNGRESRGEDQKDGKRGDESAAGEVSEPTDSRYESSQSAEATPEPGRDEESSESASTAASDETARCGETASPLVSEAPEVAASDAPAPGSEDAAESVSPPPVPLADQVADAVKELWVAVSAPLDFDAEGYRDITVTVTVPLPSGIAVILQGGAQKDIGGDIHPFVGLGLGTPGPLLSGSATVAPGQSVSPGFNGPALQVSVPMLGAVGATGQVGLTPTGELSREVGLGAPGGFGAQITSSFIW